MTTPRVRRRHPKGPIDATPSRLMGLMGLMRLVRQVLTRRPAARWS